MDPNDKQLVASVLALEQGKVPRTLNYETPDPRCPVNVVHGVSLATDQPTAVTVNLAGSGQVAAVVLVGER